MGEYRCVVRTDVGLVASHALSLQLAGISHEFSEFPQNVTVEEGEVVRFTCQIQSVPSATITWEHNKKQLPQNSRYVIVEPGVLYITSARSSDDGSYRCSAINRNIGKKRQSPEGQLTVQENAVVSGRRLGQPQLLPAISNLVNVTEGSNVTLPCASSGIPPQRLQWLAPDGAVAAMGAGFLLLNLSNVSTADSGEYICSTEDGLQKQKVTVSVWQVPKVHVKPPAQSFPAAKTVRFNCEAEGEPKPELVWFKDGARLHINGRMKQRGAELLIATTQMSDSGLYQCVARNAAGESYTIARLSIKSPLLIDPPRGLSCRSLSSEGIELSWNQPPGGNFTAFTVHYLPTEGGEETQEVTVKQSVHLIHLKPFTNYTLYTRVYFKQSASEESERVVCRTAEGVPTKAPTTEVKIVDGTTVAVSWRPLSSSEARGYVKSYKLQWGLTGAAAYSVEELPASVTAYTLTGFEPRKNYSIRVLAATSRGYPTEDLPWVTVQMPGVDAEEGQEGSEGGVAVISLLLKRINSTVLEVTWKKPNTSADDELQLWYKPHGGSEIGPMTFDANKSHTILTGLKEGSVYEIKVRSGELTGFAISVPSLTSPLEVTATPTSPRSLHISWTASSDVTRYSVAVTPLASPGSTEGKQKLFFVSAPMIEVNDLLPNSLYEVKIRGEDSSGRRVPYGQTVEVKTPEDVPGIVRDVRPEAFNQTAIRVTWRPPPVLNGVLRGYIVSVDTNQTSAVPNRAQKTVNVTSGKLLTYVTGLMPSIRYFVTVSAINSAGHGQPSAPEGVMINVVNGGSSGNGSKVLVGPIPSEAPPMSLPPRLDLPEANYNDQHLGIAVGVSIGLVCIAACVVAFMWRRRCVKMHAMRNRRGHGHGTSGGVGSLETSRYSRQRQWELEVLDIGPPVVESHIPPPPPPELFDTKGGYPNGHTNGVKRAVVSNGRIPNGHTSTGIHITENPQYKCGDKGKTSPESIGPLMLREKKGLLIQPSSATSDNGVADTSAEECVVDTTQITLLSSELNSTVTE